MSIKKVDNKNPEALRGKTSHAGNLTYYECIQDIVEAERAGDGQRCELFFLDQEKYDLYENCFHIYNQILVQFKSGKMMVIPLGMTSSSIKRYLGLQYCYIQAWAILPAASKANETPKIEPSFYESEVRAKV